MVRRNRKGIGGGRRGGNKKGRIRKRKKCRKTDGRERRRRN
jgi:hypothetical protein